MFRKLVVPMVVALAIVLTACIMSGVSNILTTFFDLPSIAIIVFSPFLLASLGFGIKKTKMAYSAPFSSSADAGGLKNAIAYFNAVLSYMVAFAGICLATGFVAIMKNLAEASRFLGPNVAVAILSVFFGALGPLLFVLPIRTAAAARLAELEPR